MIEKKGGGTEGYFLNKLLKLLFIAKSETFIKLIINSVFTCRNSSFGIALSIVY